MMDEGVWITQWVKWPQTNTNGPDDWRLTRCLVRAGFATADTGCQIKQRR